MDPMNRYWNLSHRFPWNLLIVAKHDVLKVVFSRGGKLVTNYLDAKCTLILASDHGSWQITSMWSSYTCGCNRKNQESASGPRKSFYSVTNAPGNTGGNYCCFPIFSYIVKKMESIHLIIFCAIGLIFKVMQYEFLFANLFLPSALNFQI